MFIDCSGSGRDLRKGLKPLCDIEWSELLARKLSSGDVNSVQRPVRAVVVQARVRDRCGQTLDQLRRGQPQLGAPIGLRLVEPIDERILAELLEALQRNERPRAMAQQPFQGSAFGAFDADRSIQPKRSDREVSSRLTLASLALSEAAGAKTKR